MLVFGWILVLFTFILEFSTDLERTDLERLGFESICFDWGFPLGCSTVGCRFVPNKQFRKQAAALRWVPSAGSKFMSRVWFWWIGPNLSQPWIQPGLFSTGHKDFFWVGAQPGKPRKALFFKAALLLVLGVSSCLKKMGHLAFQECHNWAMKKTHLTWLFRVKCRGWNTHLFGDYNKPF